MDGKSEIQRYLLLEKRSDYHRSKEWETTEVLRKSDKMKVTQEINF